MMRSLLKYGLQINVKDVLGETPLFYAVKFGLLNAAKVLILLCNHFIFK